MEQSNSSDAMEHTAHVKKEFSMLIDHLREDVHAIDDLAAKALFETSAEVLTGLEKAFTDYEQRNQPAWSKLYFVNTLYKLEVQFFLTQHNIATSFALRALPEMEEATMKN